MKAKGWILIIFLAIVLTSAIYFLSQINPLPERCMDKTLPNSCSNFKPFFCKNSTLEYYPEKCGCPNTFSENELDCTSDLETGEKTIELKYTLNGKTKYLEYSVYKGVADYLSNIESQTIQSQRESSRELFEKSRINEEIQKNFIFPLAIEIYNAGKTKKERRDIAISIVQSIEYEESEKEIDVLGKKIPYARFPYEVLYEQKGVCGEKSQLLYMLLTYLGEDVTILYFPEENHQAVGIKCLFKRFKSTKYCYIETTMPSKIGMNPSKELNIRGSFKKFEQIKA